MKGDKIVVLGDFMILGEYLPVIMLAAAIFAGLVFAGNMAELCGGAYDKNAVGLGKFMAFFFGLFSLAIVIAIVFITNHNTANLATKATEEIVNTFSADSFKTSISVSTIMLAVSSLILAFVPTKKWMFTNSFFR